MRRRGLVMGVLTAASATGQRCSCDSPSARRLPSRFRGWIGAACLCLVAAFVSTRVGRPAEPVSP